MGGHPYQYVVEYNDDLQAALSGSPIARTELRGLRRNLSVARENLR